ncbi:uracil-DNA glycosylase, family 4 [Rubidibacter lacunae KORDI 51-2]|uniref:Type-4 uracil-DNA glycosylase n=2 Tax=Rubidibacter TaxID=582491 RepID=U5DK39_9CHRO|nr:uracil-DNA glycosylase, family 4 [Rubidibacter lacunae KORDI 51-2]
MSADQFSLFSTPSENSTPSDASSEFDRIPSDASVQIPPGTYVDLDRLKHHCETCHRCELSGGRTQVVLSRGNPKAPIAIIGEAPGQSEDEQGLPFVGKSGQLLDKILASVRLDPARDTYICNIIKCRPPGNRTPVAPEIEACKPYLLEQLRLVDPQIVLFTGATALKGVTGEKRGITKIRGQWLNWEDRLAMAIFHPAYLLRNPSKEKGSPKWLMWQDIQKVRAKLDELSSVTDNFDSEG